MRTPSSFLLLVSVLCAACGSTSVELTEPTATRCGVSATVSPGSFPADGGTGTVRISTSRECAWSVASDAAWLVPQTTSGQGETSVPFSVTTNRVATARRAALAIGGTRLEVHQAGAECRFELDTTRLSIPAAGGNVEVRVSTLADCGWTVRPAATWITLGGDGSATGSRTVRLSIAQNTGGARQGTVTIAGLAVTVAQEAAADGPVPGPAPAPPSAAPGSPAPAPPAAGPPPPAPPPAPVPDPTPTPQPGPSDGGVVEIDGAVSGLSGSCPNLSFSVNGEHVFSDGSTQFREGHCKHVEEGRRVLVVGEREADNRVRAQRIDLRQRD